MNTKINKCCQIAIKVFFISFLFIWNLQAETLVKSVNVLPWNDGITHNMYCVIQVPTTLQVSSHSNSRLIWVLPEGTIVEKGELIAKQESFYLEKDVRRLKIDISSAISEEEYNYKELHRAQTLKEKNLISASDLNNKDRLAKQAELAREMLQVQLEESEYRLQHLSHYAPERSEILKTESKPGEYINEGDNIVQLLPTSHKEYKCELPLKAYKESQELKNVSFTASNNSILHLTRQSYSLNRDSQTLFLYLTPENPQRLILDGERLQVSISIGASSLTRIPFDALEVTDKDTHVWKINNDNSIIKTKVKVIKTQKDYFVIQSDLSAGDTLISLGKQGLKSGQKVTVIKRDLAS